MRLVNRNQQQPQKLVRGMEFPDDIVIGTNTDYQTNNIETFVVKNKSPYAKMNEFIKTGGYNIDYSQSQLSGGIFNTLSDNLFIERLKAKINNIMNMLRNIYYEEVNNINVDFPNMCPFLRDADVLFREIPALGQSLFYENINLLYKENRWEEAMGLLNIATMAFSGYIYNCFTNTYNTFDPDNLISQDKLEQLVQMRNKITLLSSNLLAQMIIEIITMENFVDLL